MKLKYTRSRLIVAIILFLSNGVFANTGFHSCQDSSVEVFQNLDQNSILDIEIQADFKKINGSPNRLEARSSGTIKINGTEIVANIEARGNSRFTYCGFRPLTLRFQGDLDGTVLEGVGKKLKLVTHCGKKEGDQWILGGTPEEQKDRLLAEFYTYVMLQELDSLILDTRLVNVSYIDEEGNKLEQGLGFLREPVKKMAKRCGLKKAKDDDVLRPNNSSIFTASLISKFIASNDWGYNEEGGVWAGHNISILKSADGLAYLAPYDFDLTAVIRPNYWKNRGLSLEEHSMSFVSWLNMVTTRSQKTLALVELKKRLAAMKAIIDNSLLSATSKDRFNKWHSIYSNVIDYAVYGEE